MVTYTPEEAITHEIEVTFNDEPVTTSVVDHVKFGDATHDDRADPHSTVRIDELEGVLITSGCERVRLGAESWLVLNDFVINTEVEDGV